jgi:hypothetical protein
METELCDSAQELCALVAFASPETELSSERVEFLAGLKPGSLAEYGETISAEAYVRHLLSTDAGRYLTDTYLDLSVGMLSDD